MAETDTDGGGTDEQGAWRPAGKRGGRVPRDEMECYNCYEKGHERRNCQNERKIKCFNCEEFGHVMRSCEKPAKEVVVGRKEVDKVGQSVIFLKK